MHKIFLQNLYITLLLPTVANMLRSSVPSGTLWLNCTANIGCLWSSCYIHTRKKSSWQNPWILNLHVIKYNNVTSLAIATKQIVQEIMEATSISWCPKFKCNSNLINLNYAQLWLKWQHEINLFTGTQDSLKYTCLFKTWLVLVDIFVAIPCHILTYCSFTLRKQQHIT